MGRSDQKPSQHVIIAYQRGHRKSPTIQLQQVNIPRKSDRSPCCGAIAHHVEGAGRRGVGLQQGEGGRPELLYRLTQASFMNNLLTLKETAGRLKMTTDQVMAF